MGYRRLFPIVVLIGIIMQQAKADIQEQEIVRLSDHRPILQFAFSADNSTAAVVRNNDATTLELLVNGQSKVFTADAVFDLTLSPDGSRVAFILIRDRHRSVSVNEKLGDNYDDVQALAFSANSHHFAYAARLDKDWFVIADGRAGPLSDIASQPCFSPDGDHLAYVVQHGGKQQVVVDGVIDRSYLAVRNLTFSAVGGHLAYSARSSAGQWMVVADTKESDKYVDLGQLRMNRDGSRVAFVAYLARVDGSPRSSDELNSRAQVVENGKVGPSHYEILSGPVFSADGAHMAYAYAQAQTSTMFSAGIVSDGATEVTERSWDLAYSPDGRHLAAISSVQRGIGSLLVAHSDFAVTIDGHLKLPLGDSAGGIVFSPDSKHVSCAIRQKNETIVYPDGKRLDTNPENEWAVALDEKTGPFFESVSPVIFSGDSLHYAYGARTKAGKWIMLLDGREIPNYELATPTFPKQIAWQTVENVDARVGQNQRAPTPLGWGPTHDEFAVPNLPYAFDSIGKLRFIGIRNETIFRVTL